MLMLLLFFFFKQKTAYEMRISDWSSDVCSSDLFDDIDARTAQLRPDALEHVLDVQVSLESPRRRQAPEIGWGLRRARTERFGVGDRPGHDAADQRQIGSASCRERVCKYV